MNKFVAEPATFQFLGPDDRSRSSVFSPEPSGELDSFGRNSASFGRGSSLGPFRPSSVRFSLSFGGNSSAEDSRLSFSGLGADSALGDSLLNSAMSRRLRSLSKSGGGTGSAAEGLWSPLQFGVESGKGSSGRFSRECESVDEGTESGQRLRLPRFVEANSSSRKLRKMEDPNLSACCRITVGGKGDVSHLGFGFNPGEGYARVICVSDEQPNSIFQMSDPEKSPQLVDNPTVYVPHRDHVAQDVFERLGMIYATMKESQGGLIHCAMGVSRSAACTLGVLILGAFRGEISQFLRVGDEDWVTPILQGPKDSFAKVVDLVSEMNRRCGYEFDDSHKKRRFMTPNPGFLFQLALLIQRGHTRQPVTEDAYNDLRDRSVAYVKRNLFQGPFEGISGYDPEGARAIFEMSFAGFNQFRSRHGVYTPESEGDYFSPFVELERLFQVT